MSMGLVGLSGLAQPGNNTINQAALGPSKGFLGGLTREMILNIVLSRYDNSLEQHRRFFNKTRDFYNLWRCIYTGQKPPFKNVVMLPLLFSACWSDVANKAAISLSGSRIIEMDPEDDQSGGSARRAEALINKQFGDTKLFEKMLDFLMMSDVYGTGILEYGWKKTQQLYTQRDSVLGVEYPTQNLITTFDGPDIGVVDILDFLPQFGKKDIDQMLYVSHRYYKDLDDLEEEAYQAQQRGEEPEFDPEALKQLRNHPPAQGVVDEMMERKNVWRSYSQFQALRQEKYTKPVELIDMVGLVPSEYAPDGVRLRIMTVANRMVVLRNAASPHWSLRKHFRSYCPMPDMHFFHGVGKIEPVSTLAASANKLVSNRLDVLDLVLQPAIFASDSTELDTQNLVLWPGRVIKIHGETGEAAIRPIQFDLQAYPLVVNELEAISQYIDMGTGVQRDTIQGLLSGDRQTAREFLGRMEQARTRLGLESKLFERAIIEPLANDFRYMDRQWLTFPRMVSLIGSNAQVDPDTGEPLPPESQEVGLTDINAGHIFRAVGASNMLSKSMIRQDFMTAMQAMTANPYALQKTNWDAFLSRWWRAFDINPKEMIVRGQPPLPPEQGGTAGQPTQADMLQQLGPGLGPQGNSPMNALAMMGAGNQPNQGQ